MVALVSVARAHEQVQFLHFLQAGTGAEPGGVGLFHDDGHGHLGALSQQFQDSGNEGPPQGDDALHFPIGSGTWENGRAATMVQDLDHASLL